jgi:hypothetical protein
MSRSRRREASSGHYANATLAFDSTVNRSASGGPPGINDDALFATADLERVLRAWDADSGTLPSRLWDVVDAFDPQKLSIYDANRVTGIANSVFGSSNEPERLAAAQQIASINRRLVTTDSASVPAPSITPPAFMLQPPASVVAPASRAIYQQLINRKPPSTLAEMLELRIRRELNLPPTPFDDYDPNGDHDFDGTLNSVDAEYNLPNPAAAQTARLARADRIGRIVQQLVAPDLLAGRRMDINRPFGDGRDNAGDGVDNNNNGAIDEPNEAGDPFNKNNGVVDDPMEAGEPYLDVNGDGKCIGEPWIDLDGNGVYTGPLDQLWQGLTAEPVVFDYTNGHAEAVHPEAFGGPVAGGVRNLNSQARQLYARHLYCLMLLLVDENYIAPWDENDPQIVQYLDWKVAKSMAADIHAAQVVINPATADQETRRIMLRKLTCRTIAQWAVNCADMRDADAIMTAFEYDENPWDGWGCMDSAASFSNIPLDGDGGTDENLGMVIDWPAIDPTDTTKIKPLKAVAAPPIALNRTRGLVWGAERPELLITETLAFHDRRTEDLGSDPSQKQMEPGQLDEDLDQRLRPKGSLFVEILNPWSPTGQYPAELYSQLTRTGPTVGLAQSDGIELGRLSTLGVDKASNQLSAGIEPTSVLKPNVLRSPVWRLIVVEEHREYRNDAVGNDEENYDNQLDPLGTQVHKGGAPPRYKGEFHPVNPDFPQFDPQYFPPNEPYVERSIYFTSDDSDRWDKGEYPYDPKDEDDKNSRTLLLKKADDKLLLPPESSKSARYFIAGDVNNVLAAGLSEDRDVPIAPIKPGRYALIGTAGAQYLNMDSSAIIPGKIEDAADGEADAPRYVTTVSRQVVNQEEKQTTDNQHVSRLQTTRRIELLPHRNPELQQVLVGGNGGTPLYPLPGRGANDPVQRDNEIVKLPAPVNGEQFYNIFDGDADEVPDSRLIPPCVAVPVAYMSLSEPLDLYRQHRKDLRTLEQSEGGTMDHFWDPLAARGEGMFTRKRTGGSAQDPTDSEAPYDLPFDYGRKEFWRNGTTRNYRTIYLQRLADPTLPWNPPPTLPDGTANNKHNPRLPVNVYRTIDGSSADLTVFNGTSSREPDMGTAMRGTGMWLPTNTRSSFEKVFGLVDAANPTAPNPNPEHRLSFRSLERGLHDKDIAAGDTATGGLPVAPRALWRQEPISTFDWRDGPTPTVDAKKNTVLGYLRESNADAITWLKKRFNDLRFRDVGVDDGTGLKGQFLLDLEAIKSSGQNFDADFDNFPPKLIPKQAHFDILMKHTLGFQNESFGALATRPDVVNQNMPVSAMGTPQADAGFARGTVPPNMPLDAGNPQRIDSTYPWLAWGNRPFVSAGELLNVPGQSSSQMLRNYSTINRNMPVDQINPYNGLIPGDTDAHRLQRYMLFQAPFGHLLNLCQTSSQPAAVDKTVTPWAFSGAPHFYRILEYVHVPSRFVGTETMLTAEIFNDVPGGPDTVGTDIVSPQDPRYNFQPPFNRVARERDPGKVNLNTVTGRRGPYAGAPRQWSEVFDGIMHRDHDMNQIDRASHFGPAWRDVVLSRKGYAQFEANAPGPIEDGNPTGVNAFGLNPQFPSVFSNPFRSPDAGDLVPLQHMVHFGIDATWQRRHHYNRGNRGTWGQNNADDDDTANARFETFNDTREAGFGGDDLIVGANGELLPMPSSIPTDQSGIPLFSESFTGTAIDGERNPYFYYQPMTRMENLVTNRSNVFAIWVTIGYFEVEPAPSWDDPAVQARFGGDGTPNSPATIAAQALYNRVYPDGYQLGREVGSDTGNVKRPRGFYIVDRTEEVGFKPGEDLNVEKMIKLRRRIE